MFSVFFLAYITLVVFAVIRAGTSVGIPNKIYLETSRLTPWTGHDLKHFKPCCVELAATLHAQAARF